MRHGQGLGNRGNCICPKCSYKIEHQPGNPCKQQKCPQCGSGMLREGGHHHQLLLEKKKGKSGD